MHPKNMPYSIFVDPRGIPVHRGEILGRGIAGMVVPRGGAAVKFPLRSIEQDISDDEVQINIKALQNKQTAYERLGNVDSIIPVLANT